MTPVVDGYQRAGRSDQLRMKCQNHSIPIKNVDGIGLPASLPNILPPGIVALPSTRLGGGLSVSRFPSVAAAVDLGAARARGFLAIKISCGSLLCHRRGRSTTRNRAQMRRR